MTRNLKALGLALLAAFAMSAVAASAASADKFTSDVSPTTVTAFDDETPHSLHYGIGTVTCKVTNFGGTQTGLAADTLNITPTYDECEFLEEPMIVRTNHCYFVFTTETVEHDGETHAPIYINCPEGEHIEIEVPTLGGCTVTIGTQTTTKGVTYTNEGAGKEADVTVDITATLEATRDNPGSNFFCSLLPSSGTGEYTGDSTLKGFNDTRTPTTENGDVTWTEASEAITEGVGTTHWNFQEGSQVGISAAT